MDAIIVCRSAREPLRFGSELGHVCSVCGERLQVTETGRRQIAMGGTPFCNSCGLAVGEALERTDSIAAAIVNPAAEEQMRRDRGSRSLRDLIERQRRKGS